MDTRNQTQFTQPEPKVGAGEPLKIHRVLHIIETLTSTVLQRSNPDDHSAHFQLQEDDFTPLTRRCLDCNRPSNLSTFVFTSSKFLP
ncbi:hypothetical protein MCOR27_001767 [Pyricularia oryzae]|uniref:Uncharacterized protein n=1 Tax=Pyricularia grisea TaxID=148305 RepID=A0ABQ8N364_PYRGI|nr:hypothetical protein MCOR26_011453 [Pyricularia oryzae]KAI6290493.1 hypothetical protein MCOR33_011264 [Pyricularia grisea]KAI6286696.1 hypothetical protein MCOR27_001767 [Pyricularia oryzae]KAI6295181.1 hypothetical protein MCOR29_011431 [Pyricularia oryzae]KAI6309790.1 hypothetical protein MCOR30_011258 [Pyricularia oryzae]